MMSELKLNGLTTEKKRAQKRYWREIKGHLYARLQYQDEAGKWKEKLKPISDKRTALRVVEEMRRELIVHGEETLQSDKFTFRELAAEYKKIEMVEPVYSNGFKIEGKRSLDSMRYYLAALLEHFAAKPIRNLKPSEIEFFKNKRLKQWTRQGKPRKIASVNRELALLRTMLNFAVQNGWLIQNPFTKTKGIIAISAEVERNRILSFDEESKLLSVCTGKRAHLKALLICALDTAMRRGEIFKMKWQDLNFETNEIHIPQTNTKTEDARIVGITPRLKDELDQLWKLSPKEESVIVFGITATIKTSFTSACKEAGISDFRFHDCRHTATTRMIASGSPHTEVMKITGHSQLKTFLRYLNITTETANKVAFRLNDYLTQGKT